MLGDCNVTKDAIDCSPPHLNDPNTIIALRERHHQWGLHDTWRHAYPMYKSFTYRAISNDQLIKSHIDRIYTTPKAEQCTFNWQHNATPVPTDHWLVLVNFAPLDAPFIGNGHWTWSIALLQNKKLTTAIVNCEVKLQTDIENTTRGPSDWNITNPQLLWDQYKNNITTMAKKHSREMHYKIMSCANNLWKDLHDITRHPDFDMDESLRTMEALLTQEIEHLEKLQARDKKDRLRAEIASHREKLGGI